MKLKLKLNDSKLNVYHEGKKSRTFVGILEFDKKSEKYVFDYVESYKKSKYAIPLSPELDLFKKKHISKKNELFSYFLDRIPLKSNPAYKDYCLSQNISPDEENPIILLGTIGKRGPSSFVFELEYFSDFSNNEILNFRSNLKISQSDFAEAFDISLATLQRIEKGQSENINILKLIEIYLTLPEVAQWQLKQTGTRVHSKVLLKLIKYFDHLSSMKNV